MVERELSFAGTVRITGFGDFVLHTQKEGGIKMVRFNACESWKRELNAPLYAAEIGLKQKLVGRSSTESELIGISDGLCHGLWMRNLLKEQGYEMRSVVLYQDNTSTITLVNKGRSTSERTRHVDKKYFFVHDRIDRGEVIVKHKSTNEMIAYIITKPLQGKLFIEMRRRLMNLKSESYSERLTAGVC
jgi:hypothetical protein